RLERRDARGESRELRGVALLLFADRGLEMRYFTRQAQFQLADVIQVAAGLHALIAGRDFIVERSVVLREGLHRVHEQLNYIAQLLLTVAEMFAPLFEEFIAGFQAFAPQNIEPVNIAFLGDSYRALIKLRTKILAL